MCKTYVGNLPTIKKKKEKITWFFEENEESNRKECGFTEKKQGKKKDNHMKRITSLKRGKDFSLLFRRGKKIGSSLFTLFVLSSPLPYSRVAVVVAKSVEKKAVARNRLRRRINEWLRKYLNTGYSSFDIAFLIKKNSVSAKQSFLYEELERQTKKI